MRIDSEASSSQQLPPTINTEISDLASSQELLSQLSIDTRLPVINEALILLDESPIPRKKLRNSKWANDKVEEVCHNIKRTLEVPDCKSVDKNTRDLHNILSGLKEKIHHEGSTRATKVQILTVLPLYWSNKKVCQEMDVTQGMAKQAKELRRTKGILSMPDVRQG